MSIQLTKSEQIAVYSIKKYLTMNDIVFLCGDEGSGKKTVLKYYESSNPETRVYQIPYEDFFFYEEDEETIEVQSLSTFQKVLDTIKLEVSSWASELCVPEIKRLIYLHRLDEIVLFGTCLAKMSGNVVYLIDNFLEELSKIASCVVTCYKNTAKGLLCKRRWFHNLTVTNQDREFLFNKTIESGETATYSEESEEPGVSDESVETEARETPEIDDVVKEKILKQLESLNIREINMVLHQSLNHHAVIFEGQKSFEQCVRYVMKESLSHSFDQTERSEAVESKNLIGCGEIIQSINRDIIQPILNVEDMIPVTKGCLFYGPPGTGKTTVCRWIAEQLDGKVYLVDHQPQKTIFETFDHYMQLAIKNRPAVVILDDIDVNLHQNQIRDFLVKLDGVENKNRDQVCVIFTCNRLNNIPETLIRGSRIETCVEFKIPTVRQSTHFIKNKLFKLFQSCKKTTEYYDILKKCDAHFFYGLSIHAENLSPANIKLAIESTFRELVYSHTSDDSLKNLEDLTYWLDEYFSHQCEKIKKTIQKSLHDDNEERFSDPNSNFVYT